MRGGMACTRCGKFLPQRQSLPGRNGHDPAKILCFPITSCSAHGLLRCWRGYRPPRSLGILRHVFCHRSSFVRDRPVVVAHLIVIVFDIEPDRHCSGEFILADQSDRHVDLDRHREFRGHAAVARDLERAAGGAVARSDHIERRDRLDQPQRGARRSVLANRRQRRRPDHQDRIRERARRRRHQSCEGRRRLRQARQERRRLGLIRRDVVGTEGRPRSSSWPSSHG